MEDIKDNLYNEIIKIYKETGSVKETAKTLRTYPIKVRRVLITEGLWHSNTSIKIASLYVGGLSVAEIAKKLFISEKNVQSYLPYTRGQYGGDNRSGEAIRSVVYRERMDIAESSQVNKKTIKKDIDDNCEKEMEENNMQKIDIISQRNKQLGNERPVPYAIKLHLELDNNEDLDEEEIGILLEFGKMENGITRDIIVP